MQNWFHIFPKNTGLSLYLWIIFCLLPFYFIFRSSSFMEIIIGILMIVLFFASYRLSFIKQGWTVYVSVGIEMAISIGMTLYFGYAYFSLFLAFFIGNIRNKAGFISLYVVHLVTTIAAITIGFFIDIQLFYSQLPFIIITLIGVILLPFNMYNRNKREKLEDELEDANERISELLIVEERQRIARDLHDTLGQKLSLIGLKSDLAGKLVEKDPDKAKSEINDIHQTARTALMEVRELVSTMKSVKWKDEIIRVKQVLEAAQMEFIIEGTFPQIPLLIEHVVSMCMREAITNMVKHSKATLCRIHVEQNLNGTKILIHDNGIGEINDEDLLKGNGIKGMKERLGFINGTLEIDTKSGKGTTLIIRVPEIANRL
ncbi:sensor histidine kinase [Oceanobacillus piezotolerans]|uniref:histidine kinase n=1 Tax=Oceanobacillus piezotolerans TaxID=2448030 RepID=A0A498DFG0_9BACI|nr:sensor histidine kinase [Oceanobacillus piezotolerans]RLL42748.1 sensor histidine kinase [Oceanobacillus piezotolerans]